MKYFTKILAFILLILWTITSFVCCATIIGGVILFVSTDDWKNAGSNLLEKILE